jgi:transglutaminase-like putative cysteine protease
MATSVPPLPQAGIRPPRPRRARRQIFFPGDLATLAIALALLILPTLSLRDAGWNLQLRILVPTVVLSIGVGYLVSRSRYNELYALLMNMLYGVSIILLVAAFAQPGGFGQGLYDIFVRSVQWFIDAFSGGVNQDDLIFTLLISGLFWFLGFNLTWHLFRVNRVWRAVLPLALIVIVNGVYYIGSANLEPYIFIFVLLALVLVVRANIEANAAEWAEQRLRIPPNLRRYVYAVGALLVLLAAGVWLIPINNVQERLDSFQEFMSSEPLQELSEIWLRLFSSAETQGPSTSDYYGGDSLQLGGAISLGDEITLYVNAPPAQYRYYWRSRTFDYYDMGRWTSAADTRLTDNQPPITLTMPQADMAAREPVRHTVTMGLTGSRLVYTAPQPFEIDLTARVDIRYTPDNAMLVSVIRPAQVIEQGETYAATSLMSVATADELRAASTLYPEWVREIYTPVFPSVTQRTISLARDIVAQAGATTPYDQAKAIELYLRTNITYDERIPSAPPGVDPVDWVLFDFRRGYCNYYASAMVVMLRSLGIPARMAAGFAQGAYDAAQGAYVVRERDAHTWVEVYFPGYGWIEFEPTAAQEPLNRGDETPLMPVPLPEDNQPTPTPSPSPTPEPTNTLPPPTDLPPTSTATQEGDQSNVEAGGAPPTATPTPTPSPSPTPQVAMVPTPPPAQRPERPNPFDVFLPGLTVILLVLLIGIIIGLIFGLAFWRLEYAGLRRKSAVVRAYVRLERYLPFIGIRPKAQQTPDERRRVVGRALPAVEPLVGTITTLYSSEKYGPPRARDAEAEIVNDVARDAWLDVREGILRRWLRRRFLFWKRE